MAKCERCGGPVDLLYCVVEGKTYCLDCGQRVYLDWLRAQPWELHASALWNPEKLERQLTKLLEGGSK